MLFPEAETIITGKDCKNPFGGWLIGAAANMRSNFHIDLTIAAPTPLVDHLMKIDGREYHYYAIPLGKGNEKVNEEYEKYWLNITEEYQPDIVHIHGTEYSHGLSYLKACGNRNVVVSIQGLTSAYYYYYYYGLSWWQVFRNITLRDLWKGTIFKKKREFKERGRYEIETIQKVDHIIGRTSWDRSRTWAINPIAIYHFCNETLREEFYTDKWEYRNCTVHSIFVSQAGYPIKGLHQLLKALPIVIKFFPDCKVRIAGYDISNISTIKDRLKITGYGKIIRGMIKDYGLEGHVSFTGPLDAMGMKNEYLRAHVFVSPSTIENSPNSLGEAQILGVPTICSYVGGAMDMIPSEECGSLYRFEEVEMLAYKICELFKTAQEFDNTKMRDRAAKRHNPQVNAKRLYSIYKGIIESQK